MANLAPPRSVVILGVPFHDVTMDETVTRLGQLIERRQPCYWATANLDFTFQASEDVELQRILVEADLVLCDGTPLVWASKALGAPLRERVAGSDLVPRLAAEAAEKGWKIFLLGGGEETLPLALANLRASHPGLQIDGYSPSFAKLLEMDFNTIKQRITSARPDVLFVAFGCPKQEKWIFMHHRRLGVPMSVGVGATVDFLAGKFKRAPRWMQVVGAEWVFRLMQEPRRLFSRYLVDLLFFVRALRAQRRALAVRPEAAVSSPNVPPPAAPMLSGDVRSVRWSGRVDAAAIAGAQIVDPSADLSAGTAIALDTSAVSFLDSSGLGFMLAAYRRAIAGGGGLALVNPSPAVAGLLDAMKLARLFPIIDEPARARAALGLTRPTSAAASSAEDLMLPIQGELTATRTPGLLRWIDDLWAARPTAKRVVVDMSAVRFMDSSGLGLLLHVHRLTAARPGAKLIISQPTENVRNVFRLAKMDNLFSIE